MKYFMSIEYLVAANKAGRDIIFDLDNTLYAERQFLFAAYKQIASILYSEYTNKVYAFLTATFLKEGRRNLFDKLMLEFPRSNLDVEDFLSILRSHRCNNCLRTYSWVNDFFRCVGDEFQWRIITNGNVQQQKNKIKSIDFPADKNRMEIIFANESSPKPATASFFCLVNAENLCQPIYVGDSLIDRDFSNNLNIEFYNVSNLL